jgi:hypothetical protein
MGGAALIYFLDRVPIFLEKRPFSFHYRVIDPGFEFAGCRVLNEEVSAS